MRQQHSHSREENIIRCVFYPRKNIRTMTKWSCSCRTKSQRSGAIRSLGTFVNPFCCCCFWESFRDVGVHRERLIISLMMWSSELKACHADLCVSSASRLESFSCCYTEIVWYRMSRTAGRRATDGRQVVICKHRQPHMRTLKLSHTWAHSCNLLSPTDTVFLALHWSPAENSQWTRFGLLAHFLLLNAKTYHIQLEYQK